MALTGLFIFMPSVVYTTAGAQDYWAIPNTKSGYLLTYISMCGGGGGGAGCNTATGSGGGAGSPSVLRYPLWVVAGKALGVKVGQGLSGGAIGANGEALGSQNKMWSMVIGNAIFSTSCKKDTYVFFAAGYGDSGAQSSTVNAKIYDFTYTNGYLANTVNTTPTWAHLAQVGGNSPLMSILSGYMGDIGRAGPSNPYSYGAASMVTVNGNGVGATSASDATNGSGGAGGGSLFGRGGTGGVYPGSVNGGNGTGYGAGGGGAANGGTGGNGTGGMIAIEWD